MSAAELERVFELFRQPEWEPRYNVAPSQRVLAIRFEESAAPREPVLLKWGYLAPWARDEHAKPQPINAKAENITGRMWGSAFKRQRCLIPATGFYEWQARPGAYKQPFHITVGETAQTWQPFAFAGLWSRWEHGSARVESCTIITTDANEVVQPIHDRMPVIIAAADYDGWLDPATPADRLLRLLRPYSGAMAATPISTLVNNVRNESLSVLAE